jgi:biopolymer transport protein ExbB
MLDHAIQFFKAGGWVMYPLLIMSILSVTVILERIMFWVLGSQRRGSARLGELLEAIESASPSQIESLVKGDRTLEGQLVLRAYTGTSKSDTILIGYVEQMRVTIERFAPTLGTIIAAAPLLGILGTVTGIIQSFDLLGEAASVSDPAIVAGGIAEALYTTAFGLSIALITLFPHVYFKNCADRALGRLELLAGSIADSSNKNE